MAKHDIIVVGASAGGVEALTKLVRDFPRDFPAAVFVVLHIPAEATSLLPEILQRAGMLPASHAVDGAKIERGRIYIAPPDHHLLLKQGYVRVARGPRENRHRPAVDPSLRSSALAYDSRVIGVILTGTLDDGTAGLLAVKHRNGIAVVQDPQDAVYPGMPQSALKHVQVDYCVPLSEIGPLLRRLVTLPAAEEQASPVPPEMEQEVRIAEMETNRLNEHEQIGKPSAFSCPECHGVLWEIQDGDLLRFRCRTGHAFSPESVIAEQSEELERALWYALKTLEEKVSLSRRLVQRAQARGQALLAQSFEAKMQEAEEHAALLRHMLTKDDPIAAP